MREIKFRAWDTNTNVMYSMKQLLLRWNTLSILTCPYFKIMQYTGLNDKNGTEIYEGDIVRFDEGLSVVRYDEETARFVLDDYGILGCLMEYGWDEGAGGIGIIDTNGFDDFNDISEIQIIGNIYENPELLEWRE